MAHEVFVSYSNKDKHVADAVVSGLETKGIRCWFAPRDVTPGTSWGQAIVDAIEACIIMVIILSENSNNSRQVSREVERAVASNVIIIPFRIENIIPTGAMAYFLSSEHWLDALTPPLEKHISKLVSTVKSFLSEGDNGIVKEPLKVPGPPPSTPFSRLWQKPFVTVLLGIIALVIFGVFFIPKLIGNTPSANSVLDADLPMAIEDTPDETPTVLPPPSFTVLGEYRTSRSANGLFIINNMLNLANGGDGLVRLNVSDPSNFKPVDTYQVEDAQEVVIDEKTAYVISGEHSQQLIIIQLDGSGKSTTFRPEAIGGAQSFYYVSVADGLAHLTGHSYWGIVDVHDPSQPKEIWAWETPTNSGNPCNAVIDGNIAYIGGGWTGLHIFDITNPENPELIGQFDTSNWVVGMAFDNEVLFLTLGEGGLISLDVSDPTRPLLMGRYEIPGFATRISIVSDILYVIYNIREDYSFVESGVIAVDISDIEELKTIAVYSELDELSDIQAVGDVVFITEEARGVVALRFGSDE